LPASKRLFEIGAYGEAILNSVASLEIALKTRFSLPVNVSFGRVVIDLREELGKIISVDELNNIRRIRNMVAHSTPGKRVTREDAETVLSAVDNIMRKLELDT
jgi:HEPN domain-containing protein